RHGLAPLLVAEPPAAALADVVLESAAVFVGHVTDLHGLHRAVENQRRAEARAEPEEEHPAAFIAAERLHRRIVDHPYWPAESLPEVIADPTRSEVERLGGDLPAQHQPGVADRHRLVGQVAGEL